MTISGHLSRLVFHSQPFFLQLFGLQSLSSSNVETLNLSFSSLGKKQLSPELMYLGNLDGPTISCCCMWARKLGDILKNWYLWKPLCQVPLLPSVDLCHEPHIYLTATGLELAFGFLHVFGNHLKD